MLLLSSWRRLAAEEGGLSNYKCGHVPILPAENKDRAAKPGQILFVKIIFEAVVIACVDLVLDLFTVEINPQE